jgi:hypothetical protein
MKSPTATAVPLTLARYSSTCIRVPYFGVALQCLKWQPVAKEAVARHGAKLDAFEGLTPDWVAVPPARRARWRLLVHLSHGHTEAISHGNACTLFRRLALPRDTMKTVRPESAAIVDRIAPRSFRVPIHVSR